MDNNLIFSTCPKMVITHFRNSSRFNFCSFCIDPTECGGNLIVGRMILYILKSLKMFSKKNYISRPLVSVIGPELTDAFYRDFCVYSGAADGFNNRSFTCSLFPSGLVMPGLPLHEDLRFVFTHHDLYGETEDELTNRVNSMANREVPV